MDDLAFYWYRFALCMYYVYGCLTSYLIMRLGRSYPGGAVRIFSGQPSSVSDPSSIAGWLQRGLCDVGRSVVEKRSILGGRLTFLQYWNLSGNLLAAM